MYQDLLTFIHNLLVSKEQRYYPPLKKYTFNMVGLDRTVTVTASNRDIAARKAYDLFNEHDLDRLEWADLIKTEEIVV